MEWSTPRDPIRNKVPYIIDEWSPTRGAGRASANGRLIMSETESAHGPRRSQRERKQVSHFTSGPSLPRSFPPFLPLTYNSGRPRFLSEEEARQT